MMTRHRFVGLLALCGFLSGCAGYRDVSLRDDVYRMSNIPLHAIGHQ
jgi:hypothetical protein